MKQPELDDYLHLFTLYDEALKEPTGPGGDKLLFLFERVVRMIHTPSPFNGELPAPFLDVARRYLANDAATHAHFAHDENRQFFLDDLADFVRLQDARRRRRSR